MPTRTDELQKHACRPLRLHQNVSFATKPAVLGTDAYQDPRHAAGERRACFAVGRQPTFAVSITTNNPARHDTGDPSRNGANLSQSTPQRSATASTTAVSCPLVNARGVHKKGNKPGG